MAVFLDFFSFNHGDRIALLEMRPKLEHGRLR